MMRRCTACHRYTMQETCPSCGEEASDPRPPKFSPEDTYGAYRRKLKRMNEAKGSSTPPTGGSP